VPTVTGRIQIPAPVPDVPATRIVVRVRDVTFADGSVGSLAETELVEDLRAEIPFSIEVPAADRERPDLNLDVHIDLDNSGYFSRGDLITVQPYAVRGDVDEDLGAVQVEPVA
jgi:hypothetical protein